MRAGLDLCELPNINPWKPSVLFAFSDTAGINILQDSLMREESRSYGPCPRWTLASSTPTSCAYGSSEITFRATRSGGNCCTAGNSAHDSRAVPQQAKAAAGSATRYEKRAVVRRGYGPRRWRHRIPRGQVRANRRTRAATQRLVVDLPPFRHRVTSRVLPPQWYR